MAFAVTDKTQQLLNATNISTNIVLEIDGISEKFGSQHITKEFLFDDTTKNFDDAGLFFDSGIQDVNSRDFISLAGTTQNITQQIQADKAIESIRSFKVALIDKNGELSTKFTPGVEVEEILARRAKVYVNIKGSNHPNDSVLLIDGLISNCTFTNKGTVELSVDHASSLKRQEVFIDKTTKLTSQLNAGATTMSLASTDDLQLPQDAVTTFVRIDDEIIQYTGISGNTLTGCVRSRFDTNDVQHSNDAEVTSFYRMQGLSLDLALKLMMSTSGYALSETCVGIQQLDGATFVDNALWFEDDDIQTNLGLIVGDHVQVSGSSSNNVTTTIKDFGKTTTGKSFIIVNSNLSSESGITCTVKFKSQFDTLTDGGGLNSTQVDVIRHKHFSDLFSSSLMTYDFYLEETIELDKFLAEQLYFPNGFYQVPGARISVQLTIPPLADIFTKTLNESNVKNPSSLKITRTINKYFYNGVVVKYDRDRLDEGKYNAGIIQIDSDSNNRIKSGNKLLKINSKGLRISSANDALIRSQARRFLDRYKFAAEFVQVETFFKNFTTEVGDTVILEGLNITDTLASGSRTFGPRIFECINKSFSLKTGSVQLQLLSTNYGLDGRFGVISPSSKVGANATTTAIPLKSSYGFASFEKNKWLQHFGSKILIHTADWATELEATLVGFDETSDSTMVVSGLASAPTEDMIIDIVNYDDDEADEKLYKTIYCYSNKQVDVVSATDTTITIDANDVQFFNINSRLEVHPSDYSNITETKVTQINSNVLTVDTMNYTPSNGDKIDLIGFKDGGEPYRII